MTDADWAVINFWLKCNRMRLIVPLKGPVRFERKPVLLTERAEVVDAMPREREDA